MSPTHGGGGNRTRVLASNTDGQKLDFTVAEHVPLSERLKSETDALTGLRMTFAIRRMHIAADREASE